MDMQQLRERKEGKFGLYRLLDVLHGNGLLDGNDITCALERLSQSSKRYCCSSRAMSPAAFARFPT